MWLTGIIISTLISGALIGLFISAQGYKTKLAAALSRQQERLQQQHQIDIQQLSQQQLSNDAKNKQNAATLDNQINKLNDAFLMNGQTVEMVSADLQYAQQSVSTAFVGIPSIYEGSQRTNNATTRSREKINQLTTSIDSLQGSHQTLEQIMTLIDNIQKESLLIKNVSAEANLLALNASIEAARAGEHGRGFAVVAGSMRELSNKSAAATIDISESVDRARKEVSNIITGIDANVATLIEVTAAVQEHFGAIEQEVANISQISQTACKEVDEANQQFGEINATINTRLESISKMLADFMGELSGRQIEDISVDSDISDMTIIDVRRPDEFNDSLGHINGATLICLQDNFEAQLKGLNKHEKYLFVCRSGGRSARAARIALASGFEQIYNLQGGMLAWSEHHDQAQALYA